MARPVITNDERRARIGHRHRLIRSQRVEDVATVADSLVGIHGTDPVSVYLSIAARMTEPSINGIANAIHAENAILRHHAMRRTLWLMTPELLVDAHVSSTVKIAQSERKRLLKWLDSSPAVEDAATWLREAIDTAVRYVESSGDASTKEIGDAHPELKVTLEVPGPSGPATLPAHTRVLLQAGFEGLLLRGRPLGSWIASQYRWTSQGVEILSGVDHTDTTTAAARLLEQYLLRFGPASETDMKWWSGWTVTLVRRALGRLKAIEVTLEDGGTGWISPHDLEVSTPMEPWLAVLPGLDATPMGWKDRGWYLGDAGDRVFDRYGNVGPTIWADGRIVGGWAQRDDGSIATEMYYPLSREHKALLSDEVERLQSLVGDTRFRFRFPSPNYSELFHH